MERNDPADNLIPGFALMLLSIITFTGSMRMLGILFTLSYVQHPDLFMVLTGLVTCMIGVSLVLLSASIPFFLKEMEQWFIPDE